MIGENHFRTALEEITLEIQKQKGDLDSKVLFVEKHRGNISSGQYKLLKNNLELMRAFYSLFYNYVTALYENAVCKENMR